MPTTIAAPKRKASSERKIFCRCKGPITLSFTSATPSRPRIFTRQLSAFKASPIPDRKPASKTRASYVIRQNKLTFVLTTPLRPDNPIADHIAQTWRRREGDRVESGRRDLGLGGNDEARRQEFHRADHADG